MPAVESALDAIEVLAASPHAWSISDLAKAVDKSPGSLFRILSTLERRGYVIKDSGTGHVQLSLRLLHLAHLTSPMRHLAPLAAPYMSRLSASLGESCHLSVLDGSDMVCIHEAPCAQAIRLVVEVGARNHLLETLSGRVVLAGMPPPARAVMMANDDALRSLTETERVALDGELDEIEERGFGIRRDGLHTGVSDVAAPIGHLAGRPMAVLTVSTLDRVGQRASIDAIVPELLDTTASITAALGVLDVDQREPAGAR